MSVDFASVFRVLTTALGLTAIAVALAALAGFGGDALLLLALLCALAGLAFRLAARGAGEPSSDKVSLIGASVIVAVLGSVLIFLVLFIWAVDGAFGRAPERPKTPSGAFGDLRGSGSATQQR